MTKNNERAAPAGRPPQENVLLGGERSEDRRAPGASQRRRRSSSPLSSRKPTLRQRVLAIIAEGPALPEAILARLRAEGVRTVLTSIRPRCSELARMGLIRDSGRRAKGEGGSNAIVWRLATPDERAAFERARAGQGVAHV